MKAGMRLVVMRNIGTLRKLVSMNQVTNHKAVTMSSKLMMVKTNKAVTMSSKLVMVKKNHQGIRKSVALNKLVRMKSKAALNRAVKMSKEIVRMKR